MIPGTSPARQAPWRLELARAIVDPEELLRLLELPDALLPAARRAHAVFPLRVPRPYLARMAKGDARDPLLRQVLPLAAEEAVVPGFGPDPVQDLAAHAAPGVLRKYAGRVLLTATGACGVHCRYCFRRHFPYEEANAARERFAAPLAYLAAHTDLHEVILSGGDPLTLRDEKLAEFVSGLRGVPHIRRLRVHTRLPVVVPSRVDDELLAWLGQSPVPVILVLHINHAREIDEPLRAACARLRASGVTLLNQAVLLSGVNDDLETLVALSEGLMDAGVLPYYLHMLDPVAGAAHFAVGETQARALLAGLRARLPGYLVPRLAREEPGASAKTILL